MVSQRRSSEPDRPRRPPATTPQDREHQLIAKAVELAERQLTDGTASSQVITHYLKLGTSRERLEQEKIGYENELLRAKKEQLDSAVRVEELYMRALNAMSSYQGRPMIEVEGDYDDD
jgi:hypothetical protein